MALNYFLHNGFPNSTKYPTNLGYDEYIGQQKEGDCTVETDFGITRTPFANLP